MRYGPVILLSLVLVLSICPARSQQQLFKQYTVNDGLIANAIRCIYQDRYGFIWIGTWEGLSKYDGHRFTNYTKSTGLSNDLINDIFEADNKLYVATNEGTVDMVGSTGIHNAVFSNIVINKIDRIGNTYIASTDDQGLYELRDGKFYQPAQAYPKNIYYGMTAMNDSLIVTLSPYTMHILDRQYGQFADLNSSAGLFFYSVKKDSKNRVWIGTESGLLLLSPMQEKGKPVAFTNPPTAFNIPSLKQPVRDIHEDSEGNIWLATVNGLVKIDAAGGRNQLFSTRDGLPSNDIDCIYEDREKNIWVGTSLGVAMLATKNIISTYTTLDGLLSDKIVFIRFADSNRLLISTLPGLQEYDITNRLAAVVGFGHNRYTHGIVQNSSPLILVQTPELYEYDMINKKMGRHIPVNRNLDGAYLAVQYDRDYMIIAEPGKILLHHSSGNITDSLEFDMITTLWLDKQKNLWVGTRTNGIYRLENLAATNNKFHFTSKTHYLAEGDIRSMLEDSKGDIWIGTRYNGVYRLKPNGSTYLFQNYSRANGTTSDWIRAITEGENGSIWLCFYQGIDKLLPADTAYRVFNFSRINNFYTSINSVATAPDHSIWLGTMQGLTHIKDGKLENSPPLPVYITSVALQDTVHRFYNTSTEKLHLDYWQNNLQLEFTSPGFINEKQLMYSYRLLGSNDTGWSSSSSYHTVSYANLQPGDYTFEVRSQGWNEQWGDTTAFHFSIRPPFWQTTWFRILSALLVFAVILLLVRRRIRHIRHEAGLKQKITETEMMALRAQMNPHFIFNSLNSIDNLIQHNEKDKATRYLARFAKLIRAILENSKHEAIPAWKDIETLKIYLELELLRCDHKFSYTLDMSDELQQGDYKVPPMIIQPFVENAIHHGLLNKKEDDRRLWIRAGVQDGKIKFVVEDNGIGREQAAAFKKINKPAHQSLGLNITRERIELHNEKSRDEIYESLVITDIKDSQGNNAGTRVEIMLENR